MKANSRPAELQYKQFLTYLRPEQYEALRDLAHKRRETIAALIRQAIDEWLERQGER